MDSLKKVQTILDDLLGPGGCPWDKEQTLETLRSSLIEEAYEVVEEINLNNREGLLEELGDLVFNIIFLCRLADIPLDDVLKNLSEKLIRRHPHVYGDKKVHTTEEVVKQWNEIKKQEKEIRTLPTSLPSLIRAEKKLKTLTLPTDLNDPEMQIGLKLLKIVAEAKKNNISAELALNKLLEFLE